MRLIRTTLLTLLVWSCITVSWTASAQSIQYTVEHITSDDGFPGAAVHAIHEDSFGFLWFGTDRGLVRFDGMAYRLYEPIEGDPYSLGGKSIVSIQEDEAGYFWLGTSTGISRFDPRLDQFQNFDHHSTVSMLLSSKDKDCIWLATSQSFSRFHIPTGTFKELHPIPMDSISAKLPYAGFPHGGTNQFGFGLTNGIHSLYEHNTGNVCSGMNWGIQCYNPETDQYRRVLPDKAFPIYDTREFPLGRKNATGSLEVSPDSTSLWVGSRSGLHELNLSDLSLNTYYIDIENLHPGDSLPVGTHIPAIHYGRKGTLWVGNRYGLYSFEPSTKKFSPIFLAPYWPEIIHEDQLGTIWIGARDGLRKIKKAPYPFYAYENPETGNGFFQSSRGIAEDEEGNILIGSSQGLIVINRDSSTKPELIAQELASKREKGVASLFIDDKRSVWIGRGPDGIDVYNPFTNTVRTYANNPRNPNPNGLSNGWVNHIIKDNAGYLWIALLGGVDRYDPSTDTFRHFKYDPDDSNSLGDNQGIRVYIPPSTPEILWISTLAGPTKYELNTGTFTNYHSNEMEGHRVIHEDVKGRFWMGSNHGLHLFNRETGDYITWRESDGLSNDEIKSILEDDQGFLWIGTFHGLSRFDPETETFKNFYKKDGLPDNNFTESGFFKSSNGEFFFMVRRENPIWFSFHPDEIIEAQNKLQVVFTQLDIKGVPTAIEAKSPLNQSMLFTEKLSLSHDQDELTFHYSGLKTNEPENLQYQYQLSGYDDSWVHGGNQKSARYNYIPPGEYTFFVRSALEGGAWSEPSSLSITISPPWWRTTIAYIAYGLLFIVGIFAFDRSQRQQIRAAERLRAEREQAKAIAKTNTELQLTLIELQNTQDQLIHAEKMASLGQLTAGIAHEIKNPLNFVNNFSRLSIGAAEELVELLEEKRGIDDEDVSDLIETLKMNARKINQHGVRADNIVRSMLDHSRTEAGEKRPIDVNKLVDEHINLAFHSWKAAIRKNGKDAPSPPVIERELDSEAGKATVVPQDIGRVLINLINNGLYAVSRESGDKSPKSGVVRVSTVRNGEFVEIKVEDNGIGIPRDKLRKIFEPFYTTKPTGSGTGLGLSLSHDIVVKGHGGQLTVKSEVGKGTEFIVRLPV